MAAKFKQKDKEILSALIVQLDWAGDPDWLKSDITVATAVLS